jgi:hypothetical protein
MNRKIRGGKKVNNPRIGYPTSRRMKHQPNPNEVHTDSEAGSAFEACRKLLLAVDQHLAVKAAGFAGVNSKGTIVDRRDHPDAIAMQKNDYLAIPEPVRCYRPACRSYRLAWGGKSAGEVECLECGKLQPTNPQ